MAVVGPRMKQAVAYVATHPHCSIIDVARHISPLHTQPERNWAYGYNPVHRAIAAGLIDAMRVGNRYYLTIPRGETHD